MIHCITEITEELTQLIRDDPVRPDIAVEQRVNAFSCVYVLKAEDHTTSAVVCVKFLPHVPQSVEELFVAAAGATTAVFYTIWSYATGAGRQLIEETTASILATRPEITTFVTLSPKTEMARKFHHKNGAVTYRENLDSVNYLYGVNQVPEQLLREAPAQNFFSQSIAKPVNDRNP